jgi:hypothetical protein
MCVKKSRIICIAVGEISMYAWLMQGAQEVIAHWMKCYMERSGAKATDWAESAKLHKSTVSRAIKEDFDSVTSVKTLDALARAAGIPSVLDFLRAQSIEFEFPDLTIELLRHALPALGCELDDVAFNKLSTILLAARSMIDKADPDLRSSAPFRRAMISAVIENANR